MARHYYWIFDHLSILSVGMVNLIGIFANAKGRAKVSRNIEMNISFLRLNFLIALTATLGSLYYSEVLKYPPCILCWYQRICIYPMVLIFGAALWTEDQKYKHYALPLLSIGFFVAAYHNLLYYGVISEALAPCTPDASCSTRQLELFGWITIPLLSLLSFLVSIAFVFFDKNKGKEI
jgi:disulfide bond formation protein DsbB